MGGGGGEWRMNACLHGDGAIRLEEEEEVEDEQEDEEG